MKSHAQPLAPPLPPLDAALIFEGKRILITGATGFVGKVALSMLLRHYPGVGKVYVLVRPGVGGSAAERYFGKVVPAPPFDPLREQHGDGLEAWLRQKTEPLAGDISDPSFGFEPELLARLRGGVDLILNCAGLVDFDPPVEVALNANTLGAKHAAELALELGASLLHVSTCYVAGQHEGLVFEDESFEGFFPRWRELDRKDFSPERELEDLRKQIARLRERAEDSALVSVFRKRAVERLLAEGRNPDDGKALHLAIGRERKIWLSGELTRVGMDRARHWGWPNTYTYTKSLGEQLIAQVPGLNYCICRPSIVESALGFPFPGWNEGFTTTAPLVFLALKGHRSYPANEKAVLDLIPVDYVAGGLLAASAATLAKQQKPVYQLGSGDTNPFWMQRAVEMVGLYRRRFFLRKKTGSPAWNRLLARVEPVPLSRERYERGSAPMIAKAARGLRSLIDELGPRWGAPRVGTLLDQAKDKLGQVEKQATEVEHLFGLFMPFIWDNRYVFSTQNIRSLHARLSPEDRERLPWAPQSIEWRHYFLDVHMDGLEKWVFPSLEEQREAAANKPVRAYRDLLEMLDASVHAHRGRTALRIVREGRVEKYSYGELGQLAARGAQALIARGVKPGDKVMLLSENRPEWGMSYFAILKAGATCVPVDSQASAQEVAKLLQSSRAQTLIRSEEVAQRLGGELPAELQVGFEALFTPSSDEGAPLPKLRGSEALASLIYTSGTTGQPKGVMLSHRNFASLLAKLSSVFDLGPSDGMLSVLPLHHTFEFSCGLLVPLAHGVEITYLEELTPDALSHALSEGRITAMVGVPALWQLLHRRIDSEVKERGPLAEAFVDGLMRLNRELRERTPLNLGKALFFPVHRKFGRIRFLISGGSALSPEVLQDFHDLGFDMFEGYGLTEAAPVLSVQTPRSQVEPGKVGKPLPGIELKIDQPDREGVGEVLARGPNVMLGYFENEAATSEVLKDGWLRTGDLGKLDEKGQLTIVGRKKDVIIDASGKNVYPDELEELYRDSPYLKELCVVGISGEDGGERIAALAVPDYQGHEALSRDELRQRLEGHFREVSSRLPVHKRVKSLHLWDAELPKTSTRKVKRPLVAKEIQRLEQLAQAAATGRKGSEGEQSSEWLYDMVARISQRSRAQVAPGAHLVNDLGFDSLMLVELAAALEQAGVTLPNAEAVAGAATMEELARLVGRGARDRKPSLPAAPRMQAEASEEIALPEAVIRSGRAALQLGQKLLYGKLLDTRVTGQAHLPRHVNFIVAANHASHLDMGLVKYALGEEGERLTAVAARDYFFDTPIKRAYFQSFTNLLPIERQGSLKESLRLAGEALRRGHHLLIFPEGTRSPDGKMAEFKPAVGYLALSQKVGVLPMYLEGTHEALPKGELAPRARNLVVKIGPLLPYEMLRDATGGMAKSDAYRHATRMVEEAVKALRDGRAPAPVLPVQRREPREPGPSDEESASAEAVARAAGEDE